MQQLFDSKDINTNNNNSNSNNKIINLFIFINNRDQRSNFSANTIVALSQNADAISESNSITKTVLLISDFKTCILIVILFCKLIFLSFFINSKYLVFNKILIILVETTIEQ